MLFARFCRFIRSIPVLIWFLIGVLSFQTALPLTASPGLKSSFGGFVKDLYNYNPVGGRVRIDPFVRYPLESHNGFTLSVGYGQTYDHMFRFKGRANPQNPVSASHFVAFDYSYGKNTLEAGVAGVFFYDTDSHALSQIASRVHAALGQDFLNVSGYKSIVGRVSVIAPRENWFGGSLTPYIKKILKTFSPGSVFKGSFFNGSSFRSGVSLKIRLPLTGRSYDLPGISAGISCAYDGARVFHFLLSGGIGIEPLTPSRYQTDENEITVYPFTWDVFWGMPLIFSERLEFLIGHRIGGRRIFYNEYEKLIRPSQMTAFQIAWHPFRFPFALRFGLQEDLINDFHNTESDITFKASFTFRMPHELTTQKTKNGE